MNRVQARNFQNFIDALRGYTPEIRTHIGNKLMETFCEP